MDPPESGGRAHTTWLCVAFPCSRQCNAHVQSNTRCSLRPLCSVRRLFFLSQIQTMPFNNVSTPSTRCSLCPTRRNVITVLHGSIHPSGRMALSVSRDRTLRLWNLLEGRCAYIKRLQGEGELVRWSPLGDRWDAALLLWQ